MGKEPKGKQKSKKPFRHGLIRFLVLVLLAFVLVANEFAFNNPQALQDTIQQQLNIGQSKFNWLYTVISLPNIVFAFFFGVIIDYFGIRKSFLIMALGLPLFQVVVALGITYRNYSLLLVGRLFFGVVSESLIIAQAYYISFWFMGKELALSLGLATTLPQFGNALNSFLTPIIFEKTQSLSWPFWTSVFLCILAFISACIVTYIDMIADQADQKNNIKVITSFTQIEDTAAQQQEMQTIKIEDLKRFQFTYWILAIVGMFALAQYVPFLDNANSLLQKRFCFSQVTAGSNITVTYLVVGLFGLPIGYLVDKLGYKRYFIMVGMSVFALGHIIILTYPQCTSILAVTHWCGASWGLFLLGIGYCFYCNCLMPSIPLIVPKKITGTAFGILSVLENTVMAIFPLITGSIIQHAKNDQIGYRHDSLFFVVSGLMGIVFAVLLLFISQKDKKILDATSKQVIVKTVNLYPNVSDTQQINTKYTLHRHSSMKKGYYSDLLGGEQADSPLPYGHNLILQMGAEMKSKSNKQKSIKRSQNSNEKSHAKKIKSKIAKILDFNHHNYASEEEDSEKQNSLSQKQSLLESSENQDRNQSKYMKFQF